MFYLDNFFGKKVLKSDLLPELRHFFTTRECPVRGNDEFFKQSLGAKRIISPVQTHSANIRVVNDCSEYPDTDGLILAEQDTAVYLSFADCTPLIFYDTINRIAAVSHAGWRGTVSRIAALTVEKMCKEFGSKPHNIKVLIGPAISLCCYEVGEDVFSALMETVSDKSGLFKDRHVDLKKINARQLEEIGVKNIDICPYCTSCDNDLFFSYRKENGTPLRHNAVVVL